VTSIDKLREYLSSIPRGKVSDVANLEPLLFDAWPEFEGSGAEKMASYKLPGRIEAARWAPPELSFEIERHGRTACGSTRADIHRWTLNLNSGTAACGKISHRQIRPMMPRLDVGSIAREIAGIINDGGTDPRLRRRDDQTVQVLIRRVLPKGSAVSQTLQDRRERFRVALENLLGRSGWERLRRDVFRRTSAS
jgi:hypothetical protein